MKSNISRGLAVGGLAALLPLAGCVSQATYEEARSAVSVEREAHQRAEARLAEVRRELSTLREGLRQRESAIQEQERRIAEADLGLKLAHQERDEHGHLVDQLRGELARVGDHLKEFSKEKEQLAQELREAEQRSRAVGGAAGRIQRLTEVVRDLTLLEGQAIQTGSVALGSNGRQPTLRVTKTTLLQNGSLGADGQRLVLSLAKLCKLHRELELVVSERTQDGALPDPVALRRVAEALLRAGVPAERVALDVAKAGGSQATAGDSGEGEVVFVLQLQPSTASEPTDSVEPDET